MLCPSCHRITKIKLYLFIFNILFQEREKKLNFIYIYIYNHPLFWKNKKKYHVFNENESIIYKTQTIYFSLVVQRLVQINRNPGKHNRQCTTLLRPLKRRRMADSILSLDVLDSAGDLLGRSRRWKQPLVLVEVVRFAIKRIIWWNAIFWGKLFLAFLELLFLFLELFDLISKIDQFLWWTFLDFGLKRRKLTSQLLHFGELRLDFFKNLLPRHNGNDEIKYRAGVEMKQNYTEFVWKCSEVVWKNKIQRKVTIEYFFDCVSFIIVYFLFSFD